MSERFTTPAYDDVPVTHRGIVVKKSLPAEYGISYQTAWRLERTDPSFPHRVLLTGDRVGWFRHELDRYFLNRPRSTQRGK